MSNGLTRLMEARLFAWLVYPRKSSRSQPSDKNSKALFGLNPRSLFAKFQLPSFKTEEGV